MYNCVICQKSIGGHQAFMAHMKTLHSDKIVEYVCPHCDVRIRWPKNFPTHYQNIHGLNYQDGLKLVKTLGTKITDNKDHLKMSSTDNSDSEDILPKKPKNAANSTNHAEFPSVLNSLSDANEKDDILFNQNCELSVQGVFTLKKHQMVLIESTKCPLIVQLLLKSSENKEGKVFVDKILTEKSNFTSVNRTTINWCPEDNTMPNVLTIRFKTAAICKRFMDKWLEILKRMMGQEDSCELLHTKQYANRTETSPLNTSDDTNNWTCVLCKTLNTGNECYMCDELKGTAMNAPVKAESASSTSTLSTKLVPFQFKPMSIDDKKANVLVATETTTILFDKPATMYRLAKDNKEWIQHGNGNLQIHVNMDKSIHILLKRANGPVDTQVCFYQTVDSSTIFEEQPGGVLTWIGRNLSDRSSLKENEQWAAKFEIEVACVQFHNILLLTTAAPASSSELKMVESEVLNILEDLQKQSDADLKKCLQDKYKEQKTKQLLEKLQTWYEINGFLEINNDSKKRFYEQFCDTFQRSQDKQSFQ